MPDEISFEMTDQLLGYAMKRCWWRRSAWLEFLGIALIAIGGILLILIDERDMRMAVAFLTIAGFAGVVLGVVSILGWYRTLKYWRQLSHRNVQFHVNDDGMNWETCLGHSFIRWLAFKKAWRFPKAWLLFVTNSTYLIIPGHVIDSVLSEFIAAKIRAHGGNVR